MKENLEDKNNKEELEKENLKTSKSNSKKENKTKNIIAKIGNFLYTIIFILVIMLLMIVLVQRFSNNTVSIGGIKIYNIISGSMEPKYEIGDIILAQEVKEATTLKVGDDIVYTGEKDDFAGKTVTHEIIKIEQKDGTYLITTKGLANDIEDPTITANQVQAKVTHKFVLLSLLSKVINNLYSMYFVIFIPIALVIFFNIIKIINDLKHPEDDEEDEKRK